MAEVRVPFLLKRGQDISLGCAVGAELGSEGWRGGLSWQPSHHPSIRSLTLLADTYLLDVLVPKLPQVWRKTLPVLSQNGPVKREASKEHLLSF